MHDDASFGETNHFTLAQERKILLCRKASKLLVLLGGGVGGFRQDAVWLVISPESNQVGAIHGRPSHRVEHHNAAPPCLSKYSYLYLHQCLPPSEFPHSADRAED
jgi:hypothetical protein